MQMLLVLNNG